MFNCCSYELFILSFLTERYLFLWQIYMKHKKINFYQLKFNLKYFGSFRKKYNLSKQVVF